MIIAFEIRCEIEGSNMETKEGSRGKRENKRMKKNKRREEEAKKRERKRKRNWMRKNSLYSHRKLCHILRVIYFCCPVIDTKL